MSGSLVPMPTWRALFKEYAAGSQVQRNVIDAWIAWKASRVLADAEGQANAKRIYEMWANIAQGVNDAEVNRDRDHREALAAVRELVEIVAQGADQRLAMLQAEQEAEYARRFLTSE